MKPTSPCQQVVCMAVLSLTKYVRIWLSRMKSFGRQVRSAERFTNHTLSLQDPPTEKLWKTGQIDTLNKLLIPIKKKVLNLLNSMIQKLMRKHGKLLKLLQRRRKQGKRKNSVTRIMR